MTALLNEKDWILTTLAIIGSGIAGRSLLYTLARVKNPYSEIRIFHSDQITLPCTLSSTAIVAPRGVTWGHSLLGDSILSGYQAFHDHVLSDAPLGVEKILQYTGDDNRPENFLKRYPHAEKISGPLKDTPLLAVDEAFLIDPQTYLEWLWSEARSSLGEKLHSHEEMITEVLPGAQVTLKTQTGKSFEFDKVVFAGGIYNKFWEEISPSDTVKKSKAVQGSYLEFNGVTLERPSFSLTYNGDNLVWNHSLKRLLIGSTSQEVTHLLPPQEELLRIFQRLSGVLNFDLPDHRDAVIRVGTREKGRRREPYIAARDNVIFWGGLYKNGFSLSLKMARDLFHQYL